ncbi:MAG: HAD family hydrolase [Nitrososphaeria archaeon]
MFEKYYIPFNKGRILLNKKFSERMDTLEGLVFDCDGVLINTNNSYRKTIKQTLSLIFKPFPQKRFIGFKEIEKLKFTGIYNNDWDSTYALALFLFTTLSREQARSLIEWIKNENIEVRGFNRMGVLELEYENFLKNVKVDPIRDPEKYAREVCEKKGTCDELKEFIEFIGKPLNVRESFLAKAFDAIYYGKELFKKIYNMEPPVNVKSGNIELESLYVSKSTLHTLKELFDYKMYLLTGRSRISVEYKIKDLEEYFNVKNSFFIEDIVREGYTSMDEFKKPSPTPLLKLACGKPTLYVGDAAEDLLLAKRAKEKSQNIFFAGIISSNNGIVKKYFIESNADLILSNVNMLPKVFKNIRG